MRVDGAGRKMRLFCCVLSAAVLSGCGGTGREIAVVDVEAVFKDYKKSQLSRERIEKSRADMEARGQEMLDEINKLVKETNLLSDDARKEREDRLKEKSAALDVYRRGATQDLLDRTNEEYQKLISDVRSAAEAVAARRGIKVVLDSTAVLYSGKGLDITGEVVAELNRK